MLCLSWTRPKSGSGQAKRLDQKTDWYRISEEDPEKQIIAPSNIEKSELIDRIRSHRASHQMPPPESNLVLSEREKMVIERWIEQGAQWETHWAYLPPEKATVPNTLDKNASEIDQFIYAAQQKVGLKAAQRAPKEILLRRLYFDIIGLPPSVNAIDNFSK